MMGSRRKKAKDMAMNQIRVKRIEGKEEGEQRKTNENSKNCERQKATVKKKLETR